MKKYGYARVSTKGQQREGYSLEAQEKTLRENGCNEIVLETHTGRRIDRPKFKVLFNKLSPGDWFVATNLSRFARSTIEGLQAVQAMFDKGVVVHILNVGVIDNTSTGRLILSILLGLAEYEADMIYERTQEGKAIARTRPGYKEGRPPIAEARMNLALNLLKDHTVKEVASITRISERSLYRAKSRL